MPSLRQVVTCRRRPQRNRRGDFKGWRFCVFVHAAFSQVDITEGFNIDTDVFHTLHLEKRRGTRPPPRYLPLLISDFICLRWYSSFFPPVPGHSSSAGLFDIRMNHVTKTRRRTVQPGGTGRPIRSHHSFIIAPPYARNHHRQLWQIIFCTGLAAEGSPSRIFCRLFSPQAMPLLPLLLKA